MVALSTRSLAVLCVLIVSFSLKFRTLSPSSRLLTRMRDAEDTALDPSAIISALDTYSGYREGRSRSAPSYVARSGNYTSGRRSDELRYGLMNQVREFTTRINALEAVLSLNDTVFSVGECKTIMVAIIFARSESLMAKFIQILRTQGQITSELLYVGARTACRRRQFKLAYMLLMEIHASNGRCVTDVDTINFVLLLASTQGSIEEGWNVFTKLLRKELGASLGPDMLSYTRIISCACRSRNSTVLTAAFQYLVNDTRLHPDPSLFIETLKFCSLTGYFEAAKEIVALLERSGKGIEPQAYSLLIMVTHTHMHACIQRTCVYMLMR